MDMLKECSWESVTIVFIKCKIQLAFSTNTHITYKIKWKIPKFHIQIEANKFRITRIWTGAGGKKNLLTLEFKPQKRVLTASSIFRLLLPFSNWKLPYQLSVSNSDVGTRFTDEATSIHIRALKRRRLLGPGIKNDGVYRWFELTGAVGSCAWACSQRIGVVFYGYSIA